MTLDEFSLDALYETLDAERRSRGLTWPQVIAEIDAPFQFVPSIPISASTIRGLRKRSVTSAVVLQILRWLNRTPESFLSGRSQEPIAAESMPDVGPRRILRFDTKAMHAALNQARIDRGLTWKQLAQQLPGFTESMLTNLASGPAIGFPRVMRLTQWLGRPAAAFMRGCDW